MGKPVDHSGEKYGMLTLLYDTGKFQFEGTKNQSHIYHCICECGNECDKSVIELKHRKNPNCGCLKDNKKKTEYGIWCEIKKRCFNKNSHAYDRYGGRGITMYKPWADSFKEFYMWIKENIGLRPGPEYSIDRINNNGNYEPGNIRWATVQMQNCNTRKNKFTLNDVSKLRKRYREIISAKEMKKFISEIIIHFDVDRRTVINMLKGKTYQVDV